MRRWRRFWGIYAVRDDPGLPVQDVVWYASAVAVRRKKKTWGGRRPGAGQKPVLKDAVSFTMDLEGPQIDALEKIARERGVSIASLVREAVEAYLVRQRKR